MTDFTQQTRLDAQLSGTSEQRTYISPGCCRTDSNQTAWSHSVQLDARGSLP
ncbi:MAG: hypothetical protein KC492_43670 [Myxococcales bacterium]|nr:hypothetical protein [Myxococcales bacterium]